MAVIPDITRSGVGLVHDQRIDSMLLLLRFDLGADEISLVAHLQWCNKKANGKYRSGGRIVGVAKADQSTAVRHPGFQFCVSQSLYGSRLI